MTSEQEKLLAMVRGIEDQIMKEHWLNVHFRAFRLSGEAWKEHIISNAQAGARKVNSPAGAVLDG